MYLSMCHFVLVFFSPFGIAITSLGEEGAGLGAFHTFVRFVLVWICWFPLALSCVFLCVILFLCFSVLLVLQLPRLERRGLVLVLFVRLFDLCLFGFVGFLWLCCVSFYVSFCSCVFQSFWCCDYLAWRGGSWSWCFSYVCSICACLDLSVSFGQNFRLLVTIGLRKCTSGKRVILSGHIWKLHV